MSSKADPRKARKKAEKAMLRKLKKGKTIAYIDSQGRRQVIDGKAWNQSMRNQKADQELMWYAHYGCMIHWAIVVVFRLWTATALPSQLVLVATLLLPGIFMLVKAMLGVASPGVLSQDRRRWVKHSAGQDFVAWLLLALTSEATRFCWWVGGFGSVATDRFYGNGVGGMVDVVLQALIPTLFGFVVSTLFVVMAFQPLPYGTFKRYIFYANIAFAAVYLVWTLGGVLLATGGGAAAAAEAVAGAQEAEAAEAEAAEAEAAAAQAE
jgi:hypothetical protein